MSRKLGKIASAIGVFLFFLALLLLVVNLWIQWRFGPIGLDLIILYLSLPLTGVDIRYFVSLSLFLLGVLSISSVFGFLVFKSYSREKVLGFHSVFFRCFAILFAAGFLCFAAWRIDHNYKVVDTFYIDTSYYTYFEENVVINAASDIAFPAGKKNMVLIIVESMEATVNESSIFNPMLMPRLHDLQQRSLGFSRHHESYGTKFSLSSFYSMLMGVPFLSMLSRHRFINIFNLDIDEMEWDPDGERRQIEYTGVSLPGVLESHGYQVELFRCASIRFNSLDEFLSRATVDCKIFDFDYFRANRDDWEAHRNSWGVDDDYLFERIKERLLDKEHAEQPYFLMVQTVNTHSPGFYVSDRPRRWNDYRDSFLQTDGVIADFIQWVQERGLGDNVCIAVVGDHLVGESNIGPVTLPPREDRGIFCMVIDSAVNSARSSRERHFATWDLPPTFLEAMGAQLPQNKFGVGTSLFSDKQTMFEQFGVSKADEMLQKRSRLYEQHYIW